MTGSAVRGRLGARASRRTRRGALAIVAALGIISLGAWSAAPAGAGIADRDPILELLSAAAELNGQQLFIEGDVVTLTDPANDQQGFQDPVADIRGAALYRLSDVPTWLIEPGGPFGCDTVVTCSAQGAAEPDVFDDGGWLFVIELEEFLALLDGSRRFEAGVLFALAEYPTTPVAPGNLAGGYSHIIVVRHEGSMHGVFEYGIGTGQFDPFITRTHARTEGAHTALLIPDLKDLPRMPIAYGAYAFSSDQTQAGTGRDVIGNIGDPPTPIGTPPIIRFQEAVSTPPPTSPPVSTAGPTAVPTAVATSGPQPTQAGPTTPVGTGGEPPWLILIALGGLLALLGAFLLLRGRGLQPVPAGPGGAAAAPGGVAAAPGGVAAAPGGPVIGAAPGDPCPPLIEAARRARAACEEASRSAEEAAKAARAGAAEAEEARRALDEARKAREAAEKELARRQEEPDRSSWMSSGDRYEDSYDLKLKADARAAANAAHADAVANATTDAERGEAHRRWQEDLEHIDSQEGLDELRQRDKEGRAKWVKEAQEALDAARDAEARAGEAANRASEAARAAEADASAARERAEEACARAEAAEQAAIDAGCMGPKPGATPTPQPPGPTPPTPPTPPPGDDTPPPGGGTPPPTVDPPPGGGTPPPKPPTPPGPPVGGSSGGGETPSRPRQCEEGAEEWRPEQAPFGAFLVPIPGEKIRISSSPSFEALDEYLDGWKGYDADSRPTDTKTAGVPPGAFRRADDSRWSQIFGGVEKKAMQVTIEVTLPLQLVRTHCERLYQCKDGVWMRTNRCRSVEHEPEPKPKVMKEEWDGAKINEIVRFMRSCVNDWKKAEDAVHELATFSNKCCK